MSHVGMIDKLISLKKMSLGDLEEITAIDKANLSRYLSGKVDIRSSAFVEILKALGIDIEEIIKSELQKEVGLRISNHSLGEAVETLLKEGDPFTTKTFLESLVSRGKYKNKKNVIQALSIVGDYKSKIKGVRGHA